jgi:hypothetical protein
LDRCWHARARLLAVFAIALGAWGPTSSAQASARPRASAAAPSRIDRVVITAKQVYYNETKGPKLVQQLGRISRDGILLAALSRSDLARAQAEADAQLRSALNHTAHVTRISVLGRSRVLVNATINGNGVYVVAPGSRVLQSHGRALGTLLVSIQDVIGFVKLVHDLTGAQVLVRGRSGQVRTSLSAAAKVSLPASGNVTVAGRRYQVRSFHETGWGNEPLTVWILV